MGPPKTDCDQRHGRTLRRLSLGCLSPQEGAAMEEGWWKESPPDSRPASYALGISMSVNMAGAILGEIGGLYLLFLAI